MKMIKLLLAILFSIAITSCGGGSSSSSGTTTTPTTTTATLSGTAAKGAAFASVTVAIKDKNGSTKTGTTGTDGKYSIDITGMTAPFLLKVSDGTTTYYSVSTATGTATANIHQFTDLIIRNWYKVKGADIDTDFSSSGALSQVPTATEIDTIAAVVVNIISSWLSTVGIDASTFNLITSSFNADGTGFDKVLDNNTVTIDESGNVTVTSKDPTTGESSTIASTTITTDVTTITIPTATITVDGNTSDWSGISALATDPQGDSSTSYTGDDIKALYVAKDSTNLYIRMDLWENANTNFGNGPSPHDGDYRVTINSNSSTYPTFIISTAYFYCGQWSLYCNDSGTSVTGGPSLISGSSYVGVSGNVIEFKVPLSVIGNPTAFYSLVGEVNDCCGHSDTPTILDKVTAMGGILTGSSTTTSAPSAPTGVSATAGDSQVTISWGSVIDATSYNIYWSTTSGVTKTNGTKIPGATSPYLHAGRTNGTTYYYVVTAVNSYGESSASSQVSTTPTSSATTVTDIDGNVYNTVAIGTQVWMKENLKVTKYRDGTAIGTTTPATLDISGETSPKYQWAYDGNESNVSTYGRLYTWYAATDSRGLCPSGWHLPTDAEWTTLTTYLGGESVAGGKMKEAGTTHWTSPNTGADNSSGFTALPGGHRSLESTFNYIGSTGYWWSATELDAARAWSRNLFEIGGNVYRSSGDGSKYRGFSVRCARD